MTKLRTLQSEAEARNKNQLLRLLENSPIFPDEKVAQAGLFQRRQELSKVLFFNEIYQQILPVHGVIMEFGVRWGQNLTTLSNLRGIHEPYNYNRKIIGFDTFSGFKNIDEEKDGKSEYLENGAFDVAPDYVHFLSEVLRAHQESSPLNHIDKFELRQGDAPCQLRDYLEENPQTIIAFAYFDFDIYKPTVECLKLLKSHLTKGSIVGFDELNDPGFPGETLALKEIFPLNEIAIRRNRYAAMQSYFVVE